MGGRRGVDGNFPYNQPMPRTRPTAAGERLHAGISAGLDAIRQGVLKASTVLDEERVTACPPDGLLPIWISCTAYQERRSWEHVEFIFDRCCRRRKTVEIARLRFDDGSRCW